LQQKENPSYWSELKRVESDYERRRFHRIQYFEAVKQAEGVNNLEDIPLPDIPAPPPPGAPGAISEIPLPDDSGAIGGSSLEVHSILKKAPVILVAPGTPMFQGREPPGVPVGPPPDLSDMDDLSDEEMDTASAPQNVDIKSKAVRFQENSEKGEDKTLIAVDRLLKEVNT